MRGGRGHGGRPGDVRTGRHGELKVGGEVIVCIARVGEGAG